MSPRVALLALVPLTLMACTGPDPAPPPSPWVSSLAPYGVGPAAVGSAAVTSGVVLLPSFEVRHQDGEALPSHVPAVAFTPDGGTLVIGTAQGEVIEFDGPTRAVRRRERFAGDAIHAVAIDRGARALCWVGGGVLEARSPATGERLGRVEDVEDAKVLAVAPRGDLLALGRGKEVEVRRLPGLDVVASSELHRGQVHALAFSPDGARLASVGEDGRLVVCDVRRDLEPLHEVKAAQPLYAACWTQDGGAVLFGGREKVIDRLDTADWKQARLLAGQPYDITTLGVSPDGARLAVGDESCDVWVFDLATRARLFHGKHHVECWLSAVAWAPDSQTFLFGCRPNTLAAKPALFAANRVVEAYNDPAHLALVEEERAALRELAACAQSGELGAENVALAEALRAQEASLAAAPSAPSAGVVSLSNVNTVVLAGEAAGDGVLMFDGNAMVQSVPDFPGDRIRIGSDAPDAVATAKQAAKAPAAKAAVEKLEAVRARRAAALNERVADLGKGFQVNVWQCR